ncbi:MAG: TonB family protein [Bacteroidetes bacterium]|nr:MAG: TonB family protein [Bacteroidota bacterium]REK03546.1 MAG: TonB family protein [Bacteroidota bacterium]REK34849.1 MAG: TonB family protein [Bacteroidota bacterium]REK51220.1 MAG: TonB family protein [Bacteroidota bacterium]
MDANIRSRSIIISVAVHAAIFLILLFAVMKTSIPPFPESGGGGGVLVNIGYMDMAAGDIQPMSDNNIFEPIPLKTSAANSEENFATQDLEDAPISRPNKPEKKNEVKKVITDVTPAKTEQKKTEPVRTADARSLYPGKTNNSRSQGTGTGVGDQGDPLGDPNSLYTGRNGSGGGSGGGSGTGTGIGEGPGSGAGRGGGVSFDLRGREMIRKPQINDRSQETGKVVVEITVNKDGNVVTAVPGGRGSTTTSSYLNELAKEAAMKAKFNPSPEGADIQKGTITFIFVVQ